MDRQAVASSSNRNIGCAPAARSWYTNSAATGSPWFHDSTITFSFGFTWRVFLITFFARASYSDILPTDLPATPWRALRVCRRLGKNTAHGLVPVGDGRVLPVLRASLTRST